MTFKPFRPLTLISSYKDRVSLMLLYLNCSSCVLAYNYVRGQNPKVCIYTYVSILAYIVDELKQ